MSDIRSLFTIRVPCSETIPLLQTALIDWAHSQDRKNWIAHGYINYFSGIDFFVHSHEPLSERQSEEIKKIIMDLGCTVN